MNLELSQVASPPEWRDRIPKERWTFYLKTLTFLLENQLKFRYQKSDSILNARVAE
jgi:hypothetical protein